MMLTIKLIKNLLILPMNDDIDDVTAHLTVPSEDEVDLPEPDQLEKQLAVGVVFLVKKTSLNQMSENQTIYSHLHIRHCPDHHGPLAARVLVIRLVFLLLPGRLV